jgi:hypothetical protein
MLVRNLQLKPHALPVPPDARNLLAGLHRSDSVADIHYSRHDHFPD